MTHPTSDAIIIGAGIIGCAIADALSRQGLRVTVVESKNPGSGTTAAVAHKMGRRWIGIELGEHAKTHCIPRLKQVVDGNDQREVSARLLSGKAVVVSSSIHLPPPS